MDKLVLGFMADVLYLKGIISYEEFEAIMDATKPSDLECIVEKLIRGEFHAYKKGESYITYGLGAK